MGIFLICCHNNVVMANPVEALGIPELLLVMKTANETTKSFKITRLFEFYLQSMFPLSFYAIIFQPSTLFVFVNINGNQS